MMDNPLEGVAFLTILQMADIAARHETKGAP